MERVQSYENVIARMEGDPREFWSDPNDNFLTPSRIIRLYLNLGEYPGSQGKEGEEIEYSSFWSSRRDPRTKWIMVLPGVSMRPRSTL